jgi:hypothetical protein
MELNKLVFAGLAVGCIAAAGGGAYFAVRQNNVPQAIVAPTSEAPATSTPSAKPVTESEGLITPATPTAQKVAPVEPAPAPRRANTVANTPRITSRPANTPRPTTTRQPAETVVSSQPSAVPAPASSNSPSMWETRPTVQPSVPEYKEPDPPPPPPPPAPEFIDITVPPDSVLGLQIERTVSSELARVEDKVDARVTRDVRVDGRVAIPAGSTVRGSVTEVDRGGRMKGKARLAVRFHTVVLADGTQLGLKTDAVVREGQSPNGETAAKVGGAAIGGAILGAILGGSKGAAVGGAVGAAGGTAAAMSNERNAATLTAGSTVTVRMQAPVTVTVQKE